MLLDLYEWFLLINDGIDLVLSNLASGTYPVPFSFLIVLILFGILSVFAWRSTDIPDLPPAPRPPYVIQITTGPAASGSRQTISDVRLLSGGFFDGHEILSRYRIISRNQSTSTERNHQQQLGTSSGDATGNAVGGRNVEIRGPFRDPTLPNPGIVRRHPPVRWFPLGLFRRPHLLTRQGVPQTTIRTQLTSSPNVVVYHRVNVYHHHIHSHPPTSGQQLTIGGNSSTNSLPETNHSQSHNQADTNSVQSSSTSSSVPQTSALNPSLVPNSNLQLSTPRLNSEVESYSLEQTSPNGASANNDQAPQTSPVSVVRDASLHNNHNQIYDAFSSSGAAASESIVETDAPTVAVAVQFGAEDNPESLNLTDTSANTEQQEHNKMTTPTSEETTDSSGNTKGEDVSNKLQSGTQQQQRCPSTAGNSHAGAIPSDGNDVRFIIKFLNDTQMDVISQLNEKIIDFKRRHFAVELAENKTVRLIFNGRVLDNDNRTLRESGIFDQCVVHCLIVNRQQQQGDQSSRNSARTGGGSNRSNQQGDALQGNIRRVVGLPEPGMFFIAFIGIFLIFLWFVCLHFGQHLFTQSAVVSLTVLTAIFLIGIVACYLPIPAN